VGGHRPPLQKARVLARSQLQKHVKGWTATLRRSTVVV